MSQPVIINVDDWVWVFNAEGQNVYEGHSIDPGRLLEVLSIKHKSYWWEPEDEDAAPDMCHRPDVKPWDFPIEEME